MDQVMKVSGFAGMLKNTYPLFYSHFSHNVSLWELLLYTWYKLAVNQLQSLTLVLGAWV